MTVKLVALYRKPEDVDAFMRHYQEVHLPLVAATPHLDRTIIGDVTANLMGEPKYFMTAEMYFPDRERFDIAMRSPENRAAGKDLMGFAADLVTLFVVDERN